MFDICFLDIQFFLLTNLAHQLHIKFMNSFINALFIFFATMLGEKFQRNKKMTKAPNIEIPNKVVRLKIAFEFISCIV